MIDGLNVLVVEDSLSTQMVIKSILSFHGLECTVVSSQAEAKYEVDHHDYSLIVLDVYLTDGTSQSFMQYVHEKNERLPVIVMTADLDEGVIANFYELGAKDFFHKPINVYLFSRKVKSVLESYLFELENYNKNSLLEKMMHEKNQEENLAFYVYDHIIQQNLIDISGVEYSSLSHGKFCGDIVISAVKPNGNLLIMLADATGHGMAAAVTIYPLVSTFTALANKGFSTAAILQALNEKHSQTIPHNRFIACIMIEVLYHENEIICWNAGMPDVLLFDKNRRPFSRVKSKHMAIGILPKEQMSIRFDRFSLDEVGEALLMSDGVIENKFLNGDKMSFQDVYEDIENSNMSPVDMIEKYSELTLDSDDMDDMSVCAINFPKVVKDLACQSSTSFDSSETVRIELTSRVFGKSLVNSDIVADLVKVLEGHNFNPDFLHRIFLVLTELVTNSIDHGVLNVPSGLKEKDFVAYLNQRSHALTSVSDNDFVEVSLQWEPTEAQLIASVQDSGEGYIEKTIKTNQGEGLHGRGLMLIKQTCASFSYDKNDNKTTVIIAA